MNHHLNLLDGMHITFPTNPMSLITDQPLIIAGEVLQTRAADLTVSGHSMTDLCDDK